MTPLSSRNALFYKRDARVEEARKHPGWAAFHRDCGTAGLFFDDIEPVGRSRRYSALAFRVEDNGSHFLRYQVARAEGDGPIGAVRATFQAAVAAGFKISPLIEAALADEIIVPQPLSDDFLADLIGAAPVADDIGELIG